MMSRSETANDSAHGEPEQERAALYEFSPEQNALIADLARKMQLVGIFLVLVGAALLVATALAWLRPGGDPVHLTLPIGLFLLLTGLWTVRSERAFRRIVDTEGRDIGHLMSAVGQLRKLFALQYWLVLVCVAMFLVSLFAGSAAIS